jgi:hypothetical protein
MEEKEIDLVQALGASQAASPQILSLYIPSVDKEGNSTFDQKVWIRKAGEMLSDLGGGVTVNPPSRGGWKSPSGEIIWEDIVILYSFIDAESFLQNLPILRKFLHQLGRETNQGEVACQFDGMFYKITEYDDGEKR